MVNEKHASDDNMLTSQTHKSHHNTSHHNVLPELTPLSNALMKQFWFKVQNLTDIQWKKTYRGIYCTSQQKLLPAFV